MQSPTKSPSNQSTTSTRSKKSLKRSKAVDPDVSYIDTNNTPIMSNSDHTLESSVTSPNSPKVTVIQKPVQFLYQPTEETPKMNRKTTMTRAKNQSESQKFNPNNLQQQQQINNPDTSRLIPTKTQTFSRSINEIGRIPSIVPSIKTEKPSPADSLEFNELFNKNKLQQNKLSHVLTNTLNSRESSADKLTPNNSNSKNNSRNSSMNSINTLNTLIIDKNRESGNTSPICLRRQRNSKIEVYRTVSNQNSRNSNLRVSRNLNRTYSGYVSPARSKDSACTSRAVSPANSPLLGRKSRSILNQEHKTNLLVLPTNYHIQKLQKSKSSSTDVPSQARPKTLQNQSLNFVKSAKELPSKNVPSERSRNNWLTAYSQVKSMDSAQLGGSKVTLGTRKNSLVKSVSRLSRKMSRIGSIRAPMRSGDSLHPSSNKTKSRENLGRTPSTKLALRDIVSKVMEDKETQESLEKNMMWKRRQYASCKRRFGTKMKDFKDVSGLTVSNNSSSGQNYLFNSQNTNNSDTPLKHRNASPTVFFHREPTFKRPDTAEPFGQQEKNSVNHRSSILSMDSAAQRSFLRKQRSAHVPAANNNNNANNLNPNLKDSIGSTTMGNNLTVTNLNSDRKLMLSQRSLRMNGFLGAKKDCTTTLLCCFLK